MARLIDADMADVIIIYDKGNELMQVSAIREYIERQREFLDKFPTIDAVPVVRCRECKHRGTDDCIFHIKGEPADEELLLKLDNDFCSYGERKGCAD